MSSAAPPNDNCEALQPIYGLARLESKKQLRRQLQRHVKWPTVSLAPSLRTFSSSRQHTLQRPIPIASNHLQLDS